MSLRGWLRAVGALLVVYTLEAPSLAEGLEEIVADPAAEQADKDYRAGVRASRAGNNTLALSLFEKALPKKHDTSDIFYNLVQVAKLEKHHDKVVLYGQAFLVLEPDTKDAADIRRLVEGSWSTLAARGRAAVSVAVGVPDGAQVFVNDTPLGLGPHVAFQLPPGNYRLAVTKTDHVTHTSELVIAAGQSATREVVLERILYWGKVKVLSNPPDGVAVFVDDKKVGDTPLAAPLELEAGKKTLLRFEKAGYDVWRRYVTLERGETLELKPVLEKLAGP